MAEPLAYFITFRCYGTWLPGDARGSTREGDQPGQPLMPPHRGRAGAAFKRLRHPPVTLNWEQRRCVDQSIRSTCDYKGWTVLALNVRTNHIHIVLVAAGQKPESVMTTLKAWSTRRLRQTGLMDLATKPWSEHGSTEYLWDERAIEATAWYVTHGQDKPPDQLSAP